MFAAIDDTWVRRSPGGERTLLSTNSDSCKRGGGIKLRSALRANM
jgi:hypothetical protein